MLYNIITVYFMERQDMEIRFNPMKITGVGAFGDVRGRTAAGIRSVYFILCTGYYDGLSEDIRELDRKLSADEHCIYRRVTDLPVMGVKEAAEYGEKWERLCRGESVISPETEKALKEVCSIYRNLRKNINPTIEKNFAAVLMFYSDRLSGKMTCDSGKCPKLVCSGRIGLKEYLFSHMAALMGIFSKAGLLSAISLLTARFTVIPPAEIYPFVRAFFEISNLSGVFGDPTVTLPFCSAMLCFGGLCVHMQIKAVCRGFSTLRAVILRVPMAVVSYFLCRRLIPKFYTVSVIAVSAPVSDGSIKFSDYSPMLSIILLIMTILILSQKNIAKPRKM